jgi:hypothetical protein
MKSCILELEQTLKLIHITAIFSFIHRVRQDLSERLNTVYVCLVKFVLKSKTTVYSAHSLRYTITLQIIAKAHSFPCSFTTGLPTKTGHSYL